MQQKLDAQQGILVALIDRVRSVDNEIIRQDTLLKTMLGVPQLVQKDKIAKADRDDQRKRLKEKEADLQKQKIAARKKAEQKDLALIICMYVGLFIVIAFCVNLSISR